MRPAAPALIALLGLAACARSAPTPSAAAWPVPRVTHSPADHPFDFVADQTVDARYGERRFRLRALIEKRGERLVMVGLTSFGARAYTLEQDGREVRVTMHIARDLPFPPEYIVLDVHRTFLAGFPASAVGPTRSFEIDGASFSDAFASARLRERQVQVHDPEETVRIEYAPEGMALDGDFPPRAVVRHPRLGYELVITTTSFRRLP